MRYLLIFMLCINISFAQSSHQATKATESKVYEIPFPKGTAANNEIELSVANTSNATINQIKVEATNIPSGINLKEKSIAISEIKAKEEQSAAFSFTVEKTAQIKKEQTLSFTISDKTGQKWTKDITLKIMPPMTYELFQNYPNPFNPTTTIEYQLPDVGTQYIVSLRIYDAIGREVANIVNEQQEPGYYQKTFDAKRYASGMYIYRLIAKDDQNKRHTFVKKMLMLK